MQSEAAKYLESNGVLLDTREVISRIEGVLFPPVSVSILDMAQYSKPVVDSHLQCLNKGLAAIESDSKICFLCFFFFSFRRTGWRRNRWTKGENVSGSVGSGSQGEWGGGWLQLG